MASLVAMPWIVINLGGEMLYVLEQRLKAQSVPAGKAARVLQDVAATLLDRAFLEEKLFVPQETYSLSSTKKIFERLAHSSIMRLSDARCAGRTDGLRHAPAAHLQLHSCARMRV